jgi:autotransporter-associated beta strand protein
MAAALLGTGPRAAAQSPYVWNGTTSGAWGTTTNWVGGNAPPLTDVAGVVLFDSNGTANLSTTLGGAYSLGTIQVGSLATGNPTGAVTIAAGTGGTLTLNGATGFDLSNATQGLTVSAPLTVAFAGSQLWTVASGQTLAVSGNLTLGAASTGLSFNGAGATTVSGSTTLSAAAAFTNTGTGLVTLGAVNNGGFGTTFTGPGAFTTTGIMSGSGGLTVNGGTTFTMANVVHTFTGNVAIDGANTVFAFTGQGNADPTNGFGAGSKTVTLTNGATLRALTASDPNVAGGKSFIVGAGGATFDAPSGSSFTLNDSGQFSGTGNLTVTSSGTGGGAVIIGQTGFGYAGYTGNVAVNSGTLRLVNTNAVGTGGAQSITVASGAVLDVQAVNLPQNITIGGTGITAGGALINSGATAGSIAGTVTLTAPTSLGGTGTGNLILNGVLTDGGSQITKVGTNTVVLANAGNSITQSVNVTAGVLGATSDAALGTAGLGITINNGAAAGGFEAFGTFTTTRTVTFANTTNTNNLLNVSLGNTFTLASALTAPNGFQKGDPGVLLLTNAGNNFGTGAVTVAGGVLRVTNSNFTGTGAVAVTGATGTALQLDGSGGSVAFANALTLTGTGVNTGGALDNFAGTNTASGAIALGGATTIGAASGTTLNITGGISGAQTLQFAGAGAINLTTNPLGAVTSVTKIGTGTTTLGVASPGYVTILTVSGGTFAINGAGQLGAPAAAVTNVINSGGRLLVDDSGAALANRLSGSTNRAWNISSGTFEYTVNAAGSSESTGALTYAHGTDVIKVNTSGQPSTLTFASLTATGASSLNFVPGGNNDLFGTTANQVKFTTAPALLPATTGILQRVYVTDAGGNVAPATYNSTNGVQAFTAFNNSGAYTDVNAANVGVTDTVRIATTGIAGTGGVVAVNGGARTLNSVFVDGSGFTLTGIAPSTLLTLTSNNLLVNGGSNTIGANIVIAPSTLTTELAVGVNAGASLAVNGVFANAGNFTKNLGGSMTINARQYSNTAANFFSVNAGSVTFNAGNNTLYPSLTQNVAVGPGATLDLNGNSQFFGDLSSPNGQTAVGAGGTLTNTGGTQATVLANYATANFLGWGGQVTGNVFLAKSGAQTATWTNDNTYTGGTLIMTAVTVQDSGRLSGTSSLAINNSQLTLSNTGLTNLTDRVNDAAPVTLRTGAILFTGRAQAVSSETLGPLTLAFGNSNINVTNGTAPASADLTFASITQGNIDATVNIQGANGLTGANSRLFFTTPPAVTNNILPVWIESGGTDFVGYGPSGVVPLGSNGGPSYTGQALPAASNPAGNYKISVAGVVPTGGLTVNTLNINAAVNVTFATPTDTLTLAAGGLMKATGTLSLVGSVVDEGRLTSAAPAVGGVIPLYVFDGVSGSTLTINSRVVDNGGTPVRLVIDHYNGGIVTLADPNNSYTGGTSVNGWISNSTGAVSLSGAGTIIPAGGLTLNNSTLTSTAAGQIAAANVVTMTGQSTLTLVGNNSLAGLVFNNIGGTSNPVVTTGGVLTLGAGTTVTAASSNPATASTINGTLDFAGSSRTVQVDPVTINGLTTIAPYNSGLTIAAVVQNGGITKTGAGNLQLSGASTFAGGVNLTAGGLIIAASSTPTTGAVTSGPLGTGTLTAGAGTTLIANASFTLANPLTVQGNLNFAGTTNAAYALTFTGPVALPAGPVTINVDSPQETVALAGTFATNPGTGITKTGLGTLALNTSYTGTVTMPAGGSLALLTDGDGTATPQAVAGPGIASTGTVNLTVGRLGTGVPPPYFTTALNKTVTLPTLSTGGGALLVTNNNGYGAAVTGPVALTGNDQWVNVATASASNVVQGLTLNGVVSGGFGIVKTGAGTLVLGNPANTFGGAASAVDIRGGVVAVAADGALGAATNTVILDANAATGVGLRATGTFATSRAITLNQANNAIEVTGGNVLTVNTPFALTASNAGLAKNDAGILALTVPNPSWNGPVTINQGAILVSDSGALGSGTVTVGNAIGAALQLTGGVTINNALNYSITGGAVSSGLNSGGGLESVSGTNTVNGLITQASGSAFLPGADAGATLNINGGVTMAGNNTFYTGGSAGGIVNMNSTLTSTGAVIKFGASTTNFTTANTGVTGALTVQGGTFVLSGSGTVGGTGAVTVNSGSTLVLDNSTTAVTNRLGNRPVTLNVGAFSFVGNSGGSTEVNTAALTIGQGGASTVNLTQTGGGNVSVQFGSLAFGVDSSVTFTGANLGTASNTLLFTTAPTTVPATTGILSRGIFTAVGGFDFVSYNNTGAAANALGIQAFANYNPTSATDINAAAATDTVNVNAGMTTQSITATKTLNALKITGPQTVGGAAGTTLTLTSGGVAATGGTPTIAVPVLAFAAVQPTFHVDSGTTLTVTSTLSGTGGFTKADPGMLVLNPPANQVGLANVTTNVTLTGTYNINGGTLQLGANNAIAPNSFLRLPVGGTLDLNGKAQYVQALFNDAITSGAGLSVEGAGGTVTGSAGSLLVANYDNTARQFSGTITGAVAFNRAGQNTQVFYGNNTYTGPTLLNGGTTSLRDGGRLSGTSSIDINYAGLTLDNNLTNPTGTKSLADRVNDAAPITLRGGTITVNGRIQTATTEALGAVSLARGFSTITMTPGTTGINSVDLTVAGLSNAANPDATLNVTGATNVLGAIGSNQRLLVTAPPTLTNNLIGGWAIDMTTGEFLSNIPGLGVGTLITNGYAGFDVNAAAFPAATTAAQNVRITAASTIPAGGLAMNSLSLRGSFVTSFTNAADVLNLTSGGLSLNQAANSMGTTALPGRLTAGGSQSTGVARLYLYQSGSAYTINSQIVDNPAGASVRLVASMTSGSIVLTNTANSYTGGTVVNGGTLTLAGTAAGVTLPAGGLTINGGTVSLSGFAGQIAPANTVTLNGPSVLSLVGNNTLAGLVFNNEGGGVTNPTVNTFTAGQGTNGAGTLTVGAGGISASSSNVSSISTVVGRIDLGASQNTISVDPILVNGVDIAPLQAGLAIQGIIGAGGGITKAGLGSLQLSGQEVYTGPTNVTAGGLTFGTLGNTGLAGGNNPGSRYSAVTLAAGTRMNMGNTDVTIGSLAGSGVVFNVAASGATTARTLNVGFDNTSTTFSGSFARFSDAQPNAYQVNKIGTGTMTLTGVSTVTGVSAGLGLQVSQGGVTFSGVGAAAFNTYLVLPTGTLTLDDSGTNVNNRLGTANTLTVGGGQFRMIGNSAAPTTETVATLNIGVTTGNLYGPGTITLVADPAQPLTLTVGTTFGAIPVGGSGLIRGVSATAGPGLANLSLGAVALGQPANSGTGANGTTTMPIRPDLLGDASTTGTGTGFITKDSATNFLRPLTAAELAPAVATGTANATVNYGLAAVNPVYGATNTIGSLTLNSGGGLSNASLSAAQPDGLPVTLTLNTGGVLAFAGNTGVGTGRMTTAGNVAFQFHTEADLAVNAVLFGTTGGLNKGEAGTLTLNNRNLYTGQTQVNGGTLKLNGGDNTLPLLLTAGAPTTSAIGVNAPGATIDLNGTNQITGTFGNNLSARYAGNGGTLTNSSTTPVVYTTISGSAQVFGGQVTGNLAFTKTGNNALTFSNVNTYTGATTVRANTLNLIDAGTLSNTSAVSVYYGGLNVDQSGLNPVGNPNPTRIPAATPVELRQATLTLTGGGSADSTAAFNTVTVTQGHSTVSVPQAPVGGTAALTIGNLVVSPDATVNFTGGNGGFFGQPPGLNNSNVFITSINGVAIPAAITNKALGGWAITNNGEFATYVSATTTGATMAWGIATMNAGAGATIPQTQYDSNTTTLPASNAASNVRLATTAAGTVNLPSGGASYNTLAFRGVASSVIGFVNATDVLNLTTGGLALTQNAPAVGTAALPGVLTSSYVPTGDTVARLYIHSSGATVNSVIANNGATPVRLVANSFGGTLTLAGNNTYTGGTVINGGSTVAFTNTTAGSVPAGGLTINGSTVTATAAANQIATTNDITLNGSATLTLGNFANTLNSLTFNNTGGTANPTVTIGTASLTLAGASVTNVIAAVNDNPATVPTVAGTLLTLPATATISASGLAPVSLVISAPIAGPTTLTKTGNGNLDLTGANTTLSGTFNLNAGTLSLGNNAALGTATLVMADGTALVSDTAVRTVTNGLTLNGNVTFGSLGGANNASTVAVNGVTVSGPVSLGTGVSRTINVNSHLNVSTLSGVVSGTDSSITKTGPGVLVLSGANTYDGGTTINGGTLQANNTAALGTTGTITFGGGILQHTANSLTDFSSRFSTANNQPFYIDTNNQPITYATALTSATGGSLGKFGAGTLTLTGNATYDGPTVINNGTLQLGSGGTSGFIPAGGNVLDAGTLNVNRSDDVTLSGVISGGGGVTKNGAGTLTLSGVNTFTGPVSVNVQTPTLGGNIKITNSSALGVGPKTITIIDNNPGNSASLQLDGSAGNITLAANLSLTTSSAVGTGGIINVAGDNVINSTTWTLTSGGGSTQVTVNAGTLTIGPGVTITPNTTARVFILNGAANGTLAGLLQDQTATNFVALQKAGAGTWFVTQTANTYTGATTITGGILNVAALANVALPSSIGAGSAAGSAADLVVNGGTLQYTGATAQSTNRPYTVGTNGATFDASGSTAAATLSLTNAAAVTTAGTNTPLTVTLTGTNTGANTLAGALGDNGTGSTSLSKAGAGTWVLNGANTYTGTTTVSAGTLVLSGSGSFATSPVVTVGTAPGSTAVLNVTGLTGGANFGTGAFTLAAGQTLSGHGTVAATGVGVRVPVGTTVAPGSTASPTGTLAVTGPAVLGGNYAFDLSTAGTGLAVPGTNGFSSPALPHTNHDVLTVTGTADVTGLTVALNSLGAPGATGFDNTKYYSWTVLTATGGVTGTPVLGAITGADFSNPGTGSFALTTDANSVYVNFAPAAVPEPATVLGLATAGLLFVRVVRRRRLGAGQPA